MNPMSKLIKRKDGKGSMKIFQSKQKDAGINPSPAGTAVAKTSIIILLVLILLQFAFLTWESLLYTCFTDPSIDWGIYIKHDKWWGNLLWFLLFILFTVWIKFLENKHEIAIKRFKQILLPVICLWIVSISVWWAFASHTTPEGDQLIVSAAAVYAKEGNLIMMSPGGQLGMHPQQLGFVGFLEILFSLTWDYCYPLLYVLYALMNGFTIFIGNRILKELGAGQTAEIVYLLLMAFCFPYYFYTPYIYGDLPSFFLGMLIFWVLIKWCKTLELKYLAILCAAGGMAVLVRKNSLIIIIAAVIGLILAALIKRSKRILLSILLLPFVVWTAVTSVETIYEVRSGFSVDGGIPATLYVAMGMQGDATRPGRFNNYHKETFASFEFDREKASNAGILEIQNHLQSYLENPLMAFQFYKGKLNTQWIEPLFESLISNDVFTEEPTGFIQDIYTGSFHQTLFSFLNRYQFLIYGGALLEIILSLLRKRPRDIGFYIPMIAILGGFLFSILWEAQCRYVLPYFIYSVGLAAWGAADLAHILCNSQFLGKYLSRKKQSI
jgi:hypothetical protein